jgi:dGTPase
MSGTEVPLIFFARKMRDGEMMMNLREKWEETERAVLSEYACLSSESRGRAYDEEECSIRTCFQRDRDRIIHSKAFRRLKHKTQVLLLPEGDHYRTRLTHTLEVSQIARTVARALRLNEDLTEAVALGHDLGHTPFGHMGEDVLDRLAKESGLAGFHHAAQSLRVVDYIEKEGKGLNLTWEVRMGIVQHSKGQIDVRKGYEMTSPSSLEGWVVRISDSIAYLNHDLDDAIRAKIVEPDDLPGEVKENIGSSHSGRINRLVLDLVENSKEGKIKFSPEMIRHIETMRRFLNEKVYVTANQHIERKRVEHVISSLFEREIKENARDAQSAVDFISGMTDRFALQQFQDYFVPSPWPESVL